MKPSISNASSLAQAAALPCDEIVNQHPNISGSHGCPGSQSMKTNMTLHISHLHKLVSRLVQFPGSKEGRHLSTLQDYVYVRDTPEADALAGDALDASIGGDVYSFGANEVNCAPNFKLPFFLKHPNSTVILDTEF